MATDEEKGADLFDEDIFDVCASKGSCMDAFRKEFEDLQKGEAEAKTALQVRARELGVANNELNNVRDQITFTQRNIDELVSAQEGITDGNEHKRSIKNSLSDREANNRSEIRSLSSLADILRENLEVGSDWTSEQMEQRTSLEKECDFLSSKLENRLSQVNGVRTDADRAYELIQEVDQEIEELELKGGDMDKKTETFMKQAHAAIAKRKSLEAKVFELRTEAITLENDYQAKRRELKMEGKSLEDLDQVLVNTKERMEANIKQYDELYKKLQDITHQLEKQKNVNVKIDDDLVKRRDYIDDKQYEADKDHKEIVKLQKLAELANEKIKQVDIEKASIEAKKDELDRSLSQLQRSDIIAVNRSIEGQVKSLASLKGELEVVRKKVTNSEKASKSMVDLILMNNNGTRNLGVELTLLEAEIGVQKKQITLMLTEKEKFEHDVENINQAYYTSLEELKLQELQIQELQNKIIEDQAKLKHKQTLYEAVRSDRNLFSKQLMDSQDAISELKRRFRTVNHTIEQLKEEIGTKDHAIVKEHFLHHSVDKERELLKNELTKIRKQVSSSEGIIDNQRVELLKLNRIIEEADQERRRQRNELIAVTAERKLLTGQVVNRNYELGGMYDKIKLQRSNLRIGERNYNKVTENIQKWTTELKNTVFDQESTVVQLADMNDLKFNAIKLDRELLTLHTKSRALMDEFDKPLNIHRWRVLESSDPKRYEKILQIQALQKELVAKSDETIQNDLLIQEKEKVYMELKKVIARQPGPEVEEQVLVYQQTFKDKVKQFNSMNEELSMYREQVKVFKADLSKIDTELDRTKKRWFKVRRAQETQNL